MRNNKDLNCVAWAMDPTHIKPFIESISGLEAVAYDVRAFEAREPNREEVKSYLEGGPWHQVSVVDGAAHYTISGPMLDKVPFIYRYFGIEAVDMSEIQAQVAEYDKREDVESHVFHVDTPGGMVLGMQELAHQVKIATKPTIAHIKGMCCSGGVYFTSAVDYVEATPGSFLGSVGVYQVLVDVSKNYSDNGVKVTVVSSGGVKGAGAEGTEITEEQIADSKRLVDNLNEEFIMRLIESGRGSEEDYRAVNTGQVWLATDTAIQGLFADIITNDMQTVSPQQKKDKEHQMTVEIINLVADHPDHAATIRDMVAAGASISDISAHIGKAEQEKTLADLQSQVEASEAKIAELEEAHGNEVLGLKEQLAAKDQELEDLRAIAELSNQSAVDPGPSGDTGDLMNVTGERFDSLDPAARFKACDQ